MALDVVAVLALFAFAWLGAHRGAAESGVRLVGLAFAYGASILAGRFAGGALGSALGAAPWIGAAGASVLGFVAAGALVELAARRVRASGDEATDVSRTLGSLLGIARGGLLLLPLFWLAAFSESVRSVSPAAGLPDLSGARVAGLGQAVVGGAAEQLAVGAEPSARMTAKLVAQPGESMAALRAIASDARIRVLQGDAGFWRDLAGGEIESALARPTFSELARDAELRSQLAGLGLVSESSALDAQQFHHEMAAVMAEVGPRIQRIQADPAFQALLADASIHARLQAGDTVALLADPRIQQLAAEAAR